MIGRAPRPPTVHRYLRASLWRLVSVAILFLLLAIGDWQLAEGDDRELDRGFHLTGLVVDDYRGGGSVPIRYDNPLVGEVTAKATRHEAEPPRADERVDIDVSRDDPRFVSLAGDRYQGTPLTSASVLVVVPLVAYVARVVSARRNADLVSATGPAFLMYGCMTASRWRRSPSLHLFAVDAKPGDRPVCTLRVLDTTGLPADGPAFPVEVKGSPRPFGRVVARAGGDVVWPRGRALGRTADVGRPGAVEAPAEQREMAAPSHPSTRRARTAGALGACSVTLVIGAVVAWITVDHAADARDLERNGTNVVAEITGNRGESSVDITFRLPDDERRVEARAPVDFPEDWEVGDRFPAVVDPTDRTRVRLLAEPYNAVDPILTAAFPVVGAFLWLLWARRISPSESASGG